MDKFEEYIKARYPVDYEHLKEKYPNVPVGEFYGDEKDLWNYRQAEVEKKDKRIEELESKIKNQIENLKYASRSWVYTEREQNIMISQADDLEKALRGEHE